jgi:hypothetical protein
MKINCIKQLLEMAPFKSETKLTTNYKGKTILSFDHILSKLKNNQIINSAFI